MSDLTTISNDRNLARLLVTWSHLALLCLSTSVANAIEQLESADKCIPHTVDQPIADKFGSVGLFANLRSSPGSIRAVAKELLSQALDTTQASPSGCPANCASSSATIIYNVLPTAYIEHTKQRKECLRFERETAETPLRFSDKQFASLDDMNEWMMDFSRGKGSEGKQLYRLCSSNCSPRYTFVINVSGNAGLQLDAEVVCGLARDRKNKRYSLSTSLRSNCVELSP